MRLGWFGVSWYVYALVCMGVALGYTLFPIDPTKPFNWPAQPLWRYIILRWFHSLVWVLLCAACLTMQFTDGQATKAAKLLSSAALVAYVVYMVFLFIEKSKTNI